MNSNVDYATAMTVTLSWDKFRQSSDPKTFAGKAGEFILLSMFELQPDAKALFDHMEGEDIRKNPRFKAHAISLVDTIDQAIACLGPDLDVLKQDLKDLGRRHFSFGVDSGYLPIMERSVLHAIEELTNGNLTDEDRKAWKALFTFILDCMMEGMSA